MSRRPRQTLTARATLPWAWPALAFALAACWSPGAAAERADDFLKALRDQGHHDLALDYLERVQDDPLVSDAFRERAPFERVVSLIDVAQRSPSPTKRRSNLQQASAEFERLSTPTGHESAAAAAADRLAQALAAAGRADLAEAARASDDAQIEQQTTAARSALESARARFHQAQRLLEKRLDDLKTAAPGSPESAERAEARSGSVQAQLQAALMLREMAATQREGSAPYRRQMRQAAEEFGALYESQSKWLVGLYAQLYEGRCYLDLGDRQLARASFASLLTQPATQPEFRKLISLAHAALVEAALEEQAQQGAGEESLKALAQSIEAPARWCKSLPASQRDTGESATLMYWLAVATERIDGVTPEAREWMRTAADVPNERQAEARTALASYGVDGAPSVDRTEPESFAAAIELGQQALRAAGGAETTASVARRANPSAVAELNAQVAAHRADARFYFEAAIRLAAGAGVGGGGEGVAIERLNEARYLLAYLYWLAEDDWRAATLASFIAQRRPEDPSAEGAARLALAALGRMQQQALAAGEPDAFETNALTRVAEFAAGRWPGTTTESAAIDVLIGAALRAGRRDEAEAALAKLPAERRAEYELKLAAAGWETIARNAEAPPAARAAALKALREALQAVDKSGGVTATETTAALYLAQAEIDGDSPRRAIELLDDQRNGPLTLAERGDPAAARPGFALEAYKAALRAFAASDSLPAERFGETLDQLESASGDSDLTRRIFLSVGVELQQRLGARLAAGEPPGAVSEALGELLDRLAGAAESWNTGLWVAQTHTGLGDAAAAGSAEAGAHYEAAAAAYRALLTRVKSDPAFAPAPTAGLALRLQLGKLEQKRGNFEEAVEAFSALLVERPTMIDVQRAAALAYQSWGEKEQDAERIEASIHGALKADGGSGHLVWGWRKLAAVTSRAAKTNPKHQDLFYESWLNVARSRYLAALLATGSDREDQLGKAESTVRSMRRQYPNLGGDERLAEYDALLRDIQRAQGKAPTGLSGSGG
ncbi:hypothetical protein Mal64_36500 [Pseudobythopirellula maris]|uniref:Uncharacterized protein n=1 Tax=Pseudobythopirellula maris TaxID=2527991 RepID=A0A5C5ZI60_9BACT|nr:hypothetical protein [Pseudobythopirellula maris]TWT86820.1 hypothetical protein Mal64_36500 [Pseudobythopirellula maris]